MPSFLLKHPRKKQPVTIDWDVTGDCKLDDGKNVRTTQAESEEKAEALARTWLQEFQERGYQLTESFLGRSFLEPEQSSHEDEESTEEEERSEWLHDTEIQGSEWLGESDGVLQALCIELEFDGKPPRDLDQAMSDRRFSSTKLLWVSRWAETPDSWCDYRPLFAALFRRRPNCRSLLVDSLTSIDSQYRALLGDLGPMWASFPRLQALSVSGNVEKLGEVYSESLRVFSNTIDVLSNDCVRSIARGHLPKLERMKLDFGESRDAPGTSEDIQQLIDNPPPRLRILHLDHVPFADVLFSMLPGSRLLEQLDQLSVSSLFLTDAGSRAILNNRDFFARLSSLKLKFPVWKGATLSPNAISSLEEALPNFSVNMREKGQYHDL